MQTYEMVMARLKRDGLSYRYKGSWYLTDAIVMTAEERRPLMLTKDVYPAIAAESEDDWRNVERCIRSALRRAQISMTAGEYINETAAAVISYED